jgi:hypothetical protein
MEWLVAWTRNGNEMSLALRNSAPVVYLSRSKLRFQAFASLAVQVKLSVPGASLRLFLVFANKEQACAPFAKNKVMSGHARSHKHTLGQHGQEQPQQVVNNLLIDNTILAIFMPLMILFAIMRASLNHMSMSASHTHTWHGRRQLALQEIYIASQKHTITWLG